MELDLTSLSLMELRDLAKANKVKYIAKYRKQELIDHLTQLLKEKDQAEDHQEEVPDQDPNDESLAAPKDKVTGKVFVDHNGVVLKEKLTRKPEEPPRQVYREDRPETEKVFPPDTIEIKGILEIQDQNNFGFLRGDNYLTTPDDIYVSPTMIRRFHLRTGDEVAGKTRPAREGEKFKALFYVDTVNGDPPGVAMNRRPFESLTPIYPNERLRLEVPETGDLATRIMDLLSPVGKGQRGLIVAPPKAGKTTILKRIAQNLRKNHSDLFIIVLLIDERPEEVTDMRESIDGDVIYSTFDEDPMNHIKVSLMVLERAKRLVEHKKDVVILVDSITRMARASNLTVIPSGRTLSGGLDPASLSMPKRFFGAARNIRNGGSLTILATSLVDTGSRMDEMIFEEFKGTGNMELHLDRRLQERRVFPAIDLQRSGTRKDELILSREEVQGARAIHSLFYREDPNRITEELLSVLDNTETNQEFLEALKTTLENQEDR